MEAMPAVRIVLVSLALALGVAAPAAAQSNTSTPPTSSPYDFDDCVNSLQRPGCGTEPESPGDRGGAAQLVLLATITGGLATIGIVIARSTARTTRARNTAAEAP